MRLAYRGITKKKIKVSVQRLVLILPVEERDQHGQVQSGSALQVNGGQVEADSAPHDSGGGQQGVRHVGAVLAGGLYDVVWDSVQNKYLRQSHHPAGDVSEVTLAATLFEAVDPVGDVGELAQLTALHEAVDPAGEDGSQSTDVSTRVSNRVNDEIVGAKFGFSRKFKN